MKVATFVAEDGRHRVGVVDTEAGSVTDVQAVHTRATGGPASELVDVLAVIDGGRAGRALLDEAVSAAAPAEQSPLSSVRLLAPLPRPRAIRDFLLYEEHLRNCLDQEARVTGVRRDIPPAWYDVPAYYRASTSTVVGHDAPIRRPAYCEELDFELEIGCVIGVPGRDIPVDEALDHVFGYTIFNDVSARDMQRRMMPVGIGPGKGKDFDSGNVLGPWIVTADELGDPHTLTLTARVNGERWGGGVSSATRFTWAEVISYVSQAETLEAGEVFGSGTVGTGCGYEHGRFLSDGDVVELEADRIGVLRNKVIR